MKSFFLYALLGTFLVSLTFPEGRAVLILLGLSVVSFLGLVQLIKSSSSSTREDVEIMSGVEYERYAERYLQSLGFKTELTKATGDYGIDIVAERRGRTYAVQVKRHKGTVSRRAVSDAVAGRIHYGCDRAMVITNSTFTKSAIALADSTCCELIEELR